MVGQGERKNTRSQKLQTRKAKSLAFSKIASSPSTVNDTGQSTRAKGVSVVAKKNVRSVGSAKVKSVKKKASGKLRKKNSLLGNPSKQSNSKKSDGVRSERLKKKLIQDIPLQQQGKSEPPEDLPSEPVKDKASHNTLTLSKQVKNKVSRNTPTPSKQVRNKVVQDTPTPSKPLKRKASQKLSPDSVTESVTPVSTKSNHAKNVTSFTSDREASFKTRSYKQVTSKQSNYEDLVFSPPRLRKCSLLSVKDSASLCVRIPVPKRVVRLLPHLTKQFAGDAGSDSMVSLSPILHGNNPEQEGYHLDSAHKQCQRSNSKTEEGLCRKARRKREPLAAQTRSDTSQTKSTKVQRETHEQQVGNSIGHSESTIIDDLEKGNAQVSQIEIYKPPENKTSVEKFTVDVENQSAVNVFSELRPRTQSRLLEGNKTPVDSGAKCDVPKDRKKRRKRKNILVDREDDHCRLKGSSVDDDSLGRDCKTLAHGSSSNAVSCEKVEVVVEKPKKNSKKSLAFKRNKTSYEMLNEMRKESIITAIGRTFSWFQVDYEMAMREATLAVLLDSKGIGDKTTSIKKKKKQFEHWKRKKMKVLKEETGELRTSKKELTTIRQQLLKMKREKATALLRAALDEVNEHDNFVSVTGVVLQTPVSNKNDESYTSDMKAKTIFSLSRYATTLGRSKLIKIYLTKLKGVVTATARCYASQIVKTTILPEKGADLSDAIAEQGSKVDYGSSSELRHTQPALPKSLPPMACKESSSPLSIVTTVSSQVSPWKEETVSKEMKEIPSFRTAPNTKAATSMKDIPELSSPEVNILEASVSALDGESPQNLTLSIDEELKKNTCDSPKIEVLEKTAPFHAVKIETYSKIDVQKVVGDKVSMEIYDSNKATIMGIGVCTPSIKTCDKSSIVLESPLSKRCVKPGAFVLDKSDDKSVPREKMNESGAVDESIDTPKDSLFEKSNVHKGAGFGKVTSTPEVSVLWKSNDSSQACGTPKGTVLEKSGGTPKATVLKKSDSTTDATVLKENGTPKAYVSEKSGSTPKIVLEKCGGAPKAALLESSGSIPKATALENNGTPKAVLKKNYDTPKAALDSCGTPKATVMEKSCDTSIAAMLETSSGTLKATVLEKNNDTLKATLLEESSGTTKTKGLEKSNDPPKVTLAKGNDSTPKATVSEKSAGTPKGTVLEKDSGTPKIKILEKISHTPKASVLEKNTAARKATVIDKSSGTPTATVMEKNGGATTATAIDKIGGPPTGTVLDKSGGSLTAAVMEESGGPPTATVMEKNGGPPTATVMEKNGGATTATAMEKIGGPPTGTVLDKSGGPLTAAVMEESGGPPTATVMMKIGGPPTGTVLDKRGGPPTAAVMEKSGGLPTATVLEKIGGPPTGTVMEKNGDKTTATVLKESVGPPTATVMEKDGGTATATVMEKSGGPPTGTVLDKSDGPPTGIVLEKSGGTTTATAIDKSSGPPTGTVLEKSCGPPTATVMEKNGDTTTATVLGKNGGSLTGTVLEKSGGPPTATVMEKSSTSKVTLLEKSSGMSKASVLEKSNDTVEATLMEENSGTHKTSVSENSDTPKATVLEKSNGTLKATLLEESSCTHEATVLENSGNPEGTVLDKNDGTLKASVLEKSIDTFKATVLEKSDGALKATVLEKIGTLEGPVLDKGGGILKATVLEKGDSTLKATVLEKSSGAPKVSQLENSDVTPNATVLEKSSGVAKSLLEKISDACKVTVLEKSGDNPKATVLEKSGGTPKATVLEKSGGTPKATVLEKSGGTPKATVLEKSGGTPKATELDKSAGTPKTTMLEKNVGPPKAMAMEKNSGTPKATVLEKSAGIAKDTMLEKCSGTLEATVLEESAGTPKATILEKSAGTHKATALENSAGTHKVTLLEKRDGTPTTTVIEKNCGIPKTSVLEESNGTRKASVLEESVCTPHDNETRENKTLEKCGVIDKSTVSEINSDSDETRQMEKECNPKASLSSENSKTFKAEFLGESKCTLKTVVAKHSDTSESTIFRKSVDTFRTTDIDKNTHANLDKRSDSPQITHLSAKFCKAPSQLAPTVEANNELGKNQNDKLTMRTASVKEICLHMGTGPVKGAFLWEKSQAKLSSGQPKVSSERSKSSATTTKSAKTSNIFLNPNTTKRIGSTAVDDVYKGVQNSLEAEEYPSTSTSSINELTKVNSEVKKKKKETSRQFNEVVLILDKQDSYLEERFKNQYPEVSFIYDENVGLHNAFRFISKHKSFRKGTLYVMMCGVMTAVRLDLQHCLYGCPPMNRYSLINSCPKSIFEHLKKYALILKQKVECNNIDRIIFTGLFPIAFNQYDLFEVQKHSAFCRHVVAASEKYNFFNILQLVKALQSYNSWVKKGLLKSSFSHWYLVSYLYFYRRIKVLTLKSSFENDGRTLIKDFHSVREKSIHEALVITLGKPKDDDEVAEVESANKILCSHVSNELKGRVIETCNESGPISLGEQDSRHVAAESEVLALPAEAQKNIDNSESLHVVLVFDEQDSYLQSLQLPYVTCVFVKDFDFHDGHLALEGLKSASQNTVFVILCGIHTMLRQEVDSECRNLKCSTPVLRVSPILTDSTSILKELVMSALSLKKRIIEGKPKHRVIFSGLLLPSLYHVDNFAVGNHHNDCNHKAPLHTKDFFAAMNKKLEVAVIRYNTWAHGDATRQGFPQWDLEKMFTSGSGFHVSFNHSTEVDGRTLTLECQGKRRKELKRVLEYTQTSTLPRDQGTTFSCQVDAFHPSHISLVYDERENLSVEMAKVSHIHVSKSQIRYQDLHEHIKSKIPSSDKTLLVIIGGIETVLQYKSDPDCRILHCSSLLQRVELCSPPSYAFQNMLISKAEKFRQTIEKEFSHIKVIFWRLLPVDLVALEEFSLKEHFTSCKHQAKCLSKKMQHEQNRNLAAAVNLFNDWTEKDAAHLGLSHWNAEELFKGIVVNSEVVFLPEFKPDGFGLSREWHLLKIKSIRTSIEKTLEQQSCAVDESDISVLEQRSSHRNEEKQPINHIVIISNTLYWHLLHDFSSPHVTVIVEKQLNSLRIVEVVKKHSSEKTKNALWLLVLGVYSFVEFHAHPGCSRFCQQLHGLHFGRSGLPLEEDLVNTKKDFIQSFMVIYRELQEILAPDSLVLLAPPIRAVVVVEELFQCHSFLHKVCEENSAFCANGEMVDVLRKFYNDFCDDWKNVMLDAESVQDRLPSSSVFAKYHEESKGQNLVPIVDTENYRFATDLWRDMLKTFIKETMSIEDANVICAPEIAPSSITTQDQVNKLKIRNVVVIGEKHLLSEIKKVRNDTTMTFIEECVDFTEACLNRFYEYQKKWPYNTAWLLLVSVSQLCVDVRNETQCSSAKCKDPLRYLTLSIRTCDSWREQVPQLEAMIDYQINCALKFAETFSRCLGPSSVACFTPITPISAMLVSKFTTHDRIHLLKDAEPGLQLLQGYYAKWMAVISYFEKKWSDLLLHYTSTSDIHDVMAAYMNKKCKIVNFVYSLHSLQDNKDKEHWCKMFMTVALKLAPRYQIERRSDQHIHDSSSLHVEGPSSQPEPVSRAVETEAVNHRRSSGRNDEILANSPLVLSTPAESEASAFPVVSQPQIAVKCVISAKEVTPTISSLSKEKVIFENLDPSEKVPSTGATVLGKENRKRNADVAFESTFANVSSVKADQTKNADGITGVLPSNAASSSKASSSVTNSDKLFSSSSETPPSDASVSRIASSGAAYERVLGHLSTKKAPSDLSNKKPSNASDKTASNAPDKAALNVSGKAVSNTSDKAVSSSSLRKAVTNVSDKVASSSSVRKVSSNTSDKAASSSSVGKVSSNASDRAASNTFDKAVSSLSVRKESSKASDKAASNASDKAASSSSVRKESSKSFDKASNTLDKAASSSPVRKESSKSDKIASDTCDKAPSSSSVRKESSKATDKAASNTSGKAAPSSSVRKASSSSSVTKASSRSSDKKASNTSDKAASSSSVRKASSNASDKVSSSSAEKPVPKAASALKVLSSSPSRKSRSDLFDTKITSLSGKKVSNSSREKVKSEVSKDRKVSQVSSHEKAMLSSTREMEQNLASAEKILPGALSAKEVARSAYAEKVKSKLPSEKTVGMTDKKASRSESKEIPSVSSSKRISKSEKVLKSVAPLKASSKTATKNVSHITTLEKVSNTSQKKSADSAHSKVSSSSSHIKASSGTPTAAKETLQKAMSGLECQETESHSVSHDQVSASMLYKEKLSSTGERGHSSASKKVYSAEKKSRQTTSSTSVQPCSGVHSGKRKRSSSVGGKSSMKFAKRNSAHGETLELSPAKRAKIDRLFAFTKSLGSVGTVSCDKTKSNESTDPSEICASRNKDLPEESRPISSTAADSDGCAFSSLPVVMNISKKLDYGETAVSSDRFFTISPLVEGVAPTVSTLLTCESLNSPRDTERDTSKTKTSSDIKGNCDRNADTSCSVAKVINKLRGNMLDQEETSQDKAQEVESSVLPGCSSAKFSEEISFSDEITRVNTESSRIKSVALSASVRSLLDASLSKSVVSPVSDSNVDPITPQSLRKSLTCTVAPFTEPSNVLSTTLSTVTASTSSLASNSVSACSNRPQSAIAPASIEAAVAAFDALGSQAEFPSTTVDTSKTSNSIPYRACTSKKDLSACATSEKKTVPSAACTSHSSSGPSNTVSQASRAPTLTCIVYPTSLQTKATILSTDVSGSRGSQVSESSSKVEGASPNIPVSSSSSAFSDTNTKLLAETGEKTRESSSNAGILCAKERVSTLTSPMAALPLKMVSHTDRIPTAVITPSKINQPAGSDDSKFKGEPAGTRSLAESTEEVEERSVVSRPTIYGIVVLNLETCVSIEQMKLLLEAFGPVDSLGRPTNILGKPAEHMWVKFLSEDVALRAKKMLNVIKLVGNPLEVMSLGNLPCQNPEEEETLEFDQELYTKLKCIAGNCKMKIGLKENIAFKENTASSDSTVNTQAVDKLESGVQPESWAVDKAERRIKVESGSVDKMKSMINDDELASSGDDDISLSSISISSGNLSDFVEDDNFSDFIEEENQEKPQLSKKRTSEGHSTITSSGKRRFLQSSNLECSKKQKLNSTDKFQNSSSQAEQHPKKTGEVVVMVSNISDVIPVKVVKSLFRACGALNYGEVSSTGELVFRFPSYKSAFVAETKLKDFRFLDKKLKVKLTGDLEEDPAVSVKEERQIHVRIRKALHRHKKTMVAAAQNIAETGVNVYNFKTVPCTREYCPSHELCHDYHSKKDKRRNPILYGYSMHMCGLVQDEMECSRKEECGSAHSAIETLFHLKKFRKHLCVGWSKYDGCPMDSQICPFAHPESPDLFFHPAWEDLYLEGLHNTLEFLAGAILNHFRLLLPDCEHKQKANPHPSLLDICILVVTPSVDMVKLLVEAVNDLALTCHHDVGVVEFGTKLPDTTVIVGTLTSLSKILKSEKRNESSETAHAEDSWGVNNIRAIILDDISSLLKDFMESPNLHLELKEILGTPYVNKVAVCEKIDAEEVRITSKLLHTTFVEVSYKKPRRHGKLQQSDRKNKLLFPGQQYLIDKNTSIGSRQKHKHLELPLPASTATELPESSNLNHSLSPKLSLFLAKNVPPTFKRKYLPQSHKVSASSSSKDLSQIHSSYEGQRSVSSYDKQFSPHSLKLHSRKDHSSSITTEKYSSRSTSPDIFSLHSSEKHYRHSSTETASHSPVSHRDDLSFSDIDTPSSSKKQILHSFSSSIKKCKHSRKSSKHQSLSPDRSSKKRSSHMHSSSASPDQSSKKRCSHKYSLSQSSVKRHSFELNLSQSPGQSSVKRCSHKHSSDHSSTGKCSHKHHSSSCKHRKKGLGSKHELRKKHVCKKHKLKKGLSSEMQKKENLPSEIRREASLSSILLHSEREGSSSNLSSLVEGTGLRGSPPKEQSLDKRTSGFDAHLIPHQIKNSYSDVIFEKTQNSVAVPSSSNSGKKQGISGLDMHLEPHQRKGNSSDSDVIFEKTLNSNVVLLSSNNTCKQETSGLDMHLIPRQRKESSLDLEVIFEKTLSSNVVPSSSVITSKQVEDTGMRESHVARACSESTGKQDALDHASTSSPKDSEVILSGSPCQNCMEQFCPLTNKEFLDQEEAMQKELSAEYQVYLDIPSVHPEYSSSRVLFQEHYQQRYGSVCDNKHKESMWWIFWKELISDQQAEEWQEKRKELVKQFEINFLKEQELKCVKNCKKTPKAVNVSTIVDVGSSSSSSNMCVLSGQLPPSEPQTSASGLATGSGKLNSWLGVPTSARVLQVPESSLQASTSGEFPPHSAMSLNQTSDKGLDSDFSLVESLILLGEVCDSLGEFFGSLMKKVIRKATEFSNTREAFHYLGAADTVKLLRMTAEKIQEASVDAEGAYKSKLLHCGHMIKSLIDSASRSIKTHTFGSSEVDDGGRGRLDIGQLAKATMHKEKTEIVASIRAALRSCGIQNPSREVLVKLYVEVSSLHAKASLNNM